MSKRARVTRIGVEWPGGIPEVTDLRIEGPIGADDMRQIKVGELRREAARIGQEMTDVINAGLAAGLTFEETCERMGWVPCDPPGITHTESRIDVSTYGEPPGTTTVPGRAHAERGQRWMTQSA